jgi:hypothetical protein
VWIAALLGGGIYYALHGHATVREQTTIVDAQPVVDHAIADVVNAAGPGPVDAITGFTRIGPCSITPVRRGFEYQRTVTLYTKAGAEQSLLDAIAAKLPARYGASASAKPVASLYADAGDFVAVNGSKKGPGAVFVRATTGCRPMGGSPTSVPSPASPSREISAVLSTLGAHPMSLARNQVACGNGRLIVTDTAMVAPSEAPRSLSDAIGKLSPSPVASTDNLFVYRSDKTDVVVAKDIDGLLISSTTRC